jgi:hypothetical protein
MAARTVDVTRIAHRQRKSLSGLGCSRHIVFRIPLVELRSNARCPATICRNRSA